MTFREEHLKRVIALYFAKRHRGQWFRSAVKIAIRDLREERGDRYADRPSRV